MRPVESTLACVTSLLICATTALTTACSQRRPAASAFSDQAAEEIDAPLFEAVLRQIQAAPYRSTVRVDPRPLKNDPALVTLHRIYEIIPERVSPGAHATLLADVGPDVLFARNDVLDKMELAQTDAWQDAKCHGVLVPPDPKAPNAKKPGCPQDDYLSVLVALPRTGGAYWPENFDERPKYRKRNVRTVRVIERSVGPDGSVEASADYVFEWGSGSAWRFIKRRALLIVE
jgi:hypothetical protein